MDIIEIVICVIIYFYSFQKVFVFWPEHFSSVGSQVFIMWVQYFAVFQASSDKTRLIRHTNFGTIYTGSMDQMNVPSELKIIIKSEIEIIETRLAKI